MNQVILLGRLTADPELKKAKSGIAYTQFTLAVDRKYKNALGTRETDFLSCTAFKQTAEIICKYFKKGNRLPLVGSIQTSNYKDDSGKTVYRTDIMIDSVEFFDEAGTKAKSKNEDLPFEI